MITVIYNKNVKSILRVTIRVKKKYRFYHLEDVILINGFNLVIKH